MKCALLCYEIHHVLVWYTENVSVYRSLSFIVSLFYWISFLCTGSTLLWQIHCFTRGLCYVTCSVRVRIRSSLKHRLDSLVQHKGKSRTRKSNSATLPSKRAAEAFSSLKHRPSTKTWKLKCYLLYYVHSSIYTHLPELTWELKKAGEYHRHVHFARKR